MLNSQEPAQNFRIPSIEEMSQKYSRENIQAILQ